MGTVRTWAASGADEVVTLTSMVTVVGRLGDQFDALGETPTPKIFAWRMKTKMATAAVPGQSIQIYMANARDGDATVVDGGFGQADATITAANITSGFLNNLKHIGNVMMDDDNGTPPIMQGSGRFVLYERYFSPVFYNATDDQMSTTAGDHAFEIEDITSEI